ncbi:MAG TPA: hypothetical protein VMU80_06850, partial [Bryobacteraceae bacterium]|nr:hypothetical protein [Bryobacteraceae bacterium]
MIVNPIPETPPVTRPRPRAGRTALLIFFGVIAVLIGASVIGGLLPRLTREKALLADAATEAAQAPAVEVAVAREA